MPLRLRVGRPTTSTVPYSESRDGTRVSVTLIVRRAPEASVKEESLTRTKRDSVRRRSAATAPLRLWRHGRAATATLSLRPDVLAISTVPAAPLRAVCSTTAGVIDRPPA